VGFARFVGYTGGGWGSKYDWAAIEVGWLGVGAGGRLRGQRDGRDVPDGVQTQVDDLDRGGRERVSIGGLVSRMEALKKILLERRPGNGKLIGLALVAHIELRLEGDGFTLKPFNEQVVASAGKERGKEI
jgi:hypothetical protein